ncbi:hypothetical protein Fuma_05605 [Fuerstiella marisgermanici]|uniref:Uncharacterized protein n=1 Tax=Fuerstiella marisgermanici TaxID=1891926 RepID=A0A1P8WPF2_9PLAN|nr:hypothetical protein Fuma_05605 [Fuerstiella marisgermanici]
MPQRDTTAASTAQTVNARLSVTNTDTCSSRDSFGIMVLQGDCLHSARIDVLAEALNRSRSSQTF